MSRAKKEVDECYPEFVRLWIEYNPHLRFNAMSGKMIKELIADTKWRRQSVGMDMDKEQVAFAFKYVLEYMKRVNHFYYRKPINQFRQNYLAIIDEIQQGKNGRIGTTKKQTTWDRVSNL